MKVLKKQGLTLMLIAALVVTLTLGIIFMLPARTAKASDVQVGDAEALQNAINNAPDGVNCEIQLTDDISGNVRFYIDVDKVITIDLNGHTLESDTTNYFITNAGTLTLVDRKGGGLISVSTDYGMPLLNYGTATSSVDIQSKCIPFSNIMMSIKNEDEVYYTRYYRRPSLTITDGTITCAASSRYGTLYYFIRNLDGDLAISGGKFINGNDSSDLDFLDIESSTLDPFDPWFEPDDPEFLKDVEIRKNAEASGEFKSLHKSVVRISGGDYTDLSIAGNIVVDKAVKVIAGYDRYFGNTFEQVDNEEISVDMEISGGKWAKEFPEYTAEGSIFVQQTDYDSEGEIISQYFTVDKINSNNIGVELIADGKTLYFSSFDFAWASAIGDAEWSDTRVLKLNKDLTIGKLTTSDSTGAVAIDLNGHDLTIEGTGTMSSLISSTSGGPITTLIVRDSSDLQNGELVLSYRDVRDSTGDGYILINSRLKFVLESGTIRQIGSFPDNWVNENRKVFALFKTKISKLSDGAITIKGGNIISQLQFGDVTKAADLMGWEDGGFNFEGSSTEEKEKIFVFDYKDYFTENPTKTLEISWNVSEQIKDYGLVCGSVGDGLYIISKSSENAKFFASTDGVNVTDHETLAAALQALGESGGTISALCSSDINEDITIRDGVTLDLNRSDFCLTFSEGKSLTLEKGATLRNGIISGNVIVAGHATVEHTSVSGGTVTLQQTAELELSDGDFDCTFDIVEGAKLSISGGSFRGSEIEKLDKYFTQFHGAWKEANAEYATNTLYPVTIAPNLAAQEWYKEKVNGNSLTIQTVDDWNTFALYVNSGVDTFEGKTVKLDGETVAATNGGKSRAAEEKVLDFKGKIFLPAGNLQHGFAGTFDGEGTKFINIDAHELFVGLFGTVESSARLYNITIEDSTFKIDKGYLDELNKGGGFYAAGAIIGHGFLLVNSEKTDMSGNFTLSNVSVDFNVNAIPSTGGINWDASFFIGGIIGHSWGNVILENVIFKNHCTVNGNWKTGGIVGFLDGEFYLRNADIEQGTQQDQSDNGLVVKGGTYNAVLVGHAHNAKNTVENCTVLEHDKSLFGSLYRNDNSTEGSITITGPETELDVFRIVGGTRSSGTTDIVISQEVTEEGGVKRGSVKLQEADNGLKFYEEKGGEKTPLEVQPNEQGGFEAVAKVDVTIGGLKMNENETVTFSGTDTVITIDKVAGFTLFDKFGNPVKPEMIGDVSISVTLELSNCKVGTMTALIISYTITGADAKNFNFRLSDNQTFIEVEIVATTLQVSVNSNGEVEYDGFVGGENESVLGGELTLNKVDNGDGTYTVTPSGLESENYNIVYVSRVVPAEAFETESNSLWIALAVVGSAIFLLGAVAVVYAVRKRKE